MNHVTIPNFYHGDNHKTNVPFYWNVMFIDLIA